MDYYSRVLVTIPLTMLVPFVLLSAAGVATTVAMSLAALPATGLLYHALFVREPCEA